MSCSHVLQSYVVDAAANLFPKCAVFMKNDFRLDLAWIIWFKSLEDDFQAV